MFIVETKPKSISAEAYRTLRTNILLLIRKLELLLLLVLNQEKENLQQQVI